MADLVLGDDHAVFVEALTAALPQKGFTVVGTATSIRDTLASVRRHRPDVCLLDRYFADGDGIDAIGSVAESGSATMRIVIVTADRDVLAMRRALRSGASGYVNKMCGLAALVEAIRSVAAGEVVTQLPALRAPGPPGGGQQPPLTSELTGRERQCLGLLVAGAGTNSMAAELGVSPTTVRTHVQALLSKLGAHSRLEAASIALRHSLLTEDDIPDRISG